FFKKISLNRVQLIQLFISFEKKMLTKDFFIKNRSKILDKLENKSIALVIAADEIPRNGDQTFTFRQSSDLFYLTGIEQEKTLLIINNCHPDVNKREILFVRRTSELIETWEGHKHSKDEAKEISGVENVKFFDEMESLLGDLMFYADNIYLNTNGNVKYNRFYNDADYRFIEKLRYQFPLHTYKRLSPIIVKNRLQKSSEEIEVMKKAINITKSAFLRILKFIKPGVGEYEINAEITHEFIRNKAFTHAYPPIIASGKDNNILHYTQNNKICNNGELILMDFGAEYLNYAADMSRTVPVNGKFDEFQLKVYNATLKVQKEAFKLMKPGMTINKWNKKVGQIMENELLELGLLTTKDIKNQDSDCPAYKKYYMHGTGHFLGLDVHDIGTTDTPWKAGMILTNEPGIYIKEKGFGVRLENNILITENEPIDLMADIPIEADEIMKLMS
ncbi:MAG: aminopeptidase P N-terminal domain-containing protein, partial [Bacteroidota bacterium]|nr:aminopeptidase P N-terminal domain-containing protein [Bacteroidota bacterium]